MRRHCVLLAAIAWGGLLAADQAGGKVEYAGGTIGELAHGPKGRLITVNESFLVFEWKASHYMVRWESINLLEYGQRVGRRYAMAVLISPVLALSKSRKHYLTIGFTDEDGRQQALVFRVDKGDIRSLLVSIEAKANVRVEYQDEDARRGGKG